MQSRNNSFLRTFPILCLLLFFPLIGLSSQPNQTTQQSELVIAGVRVGSLKLGDSRERALELFPLTKDADQEYPQPGECGTELDWVDSRDPKHEGNVFIHFRRGVIFQIDVSDLSFRTPDGITFLSSPEQVRTRHPKLEAWTLSGNTGGEALGERQLVYWIDRNAGIAFSFAYSQSERKRYVYEIIVFKPGTDICPHDDSTNSANKKKLTPFSLGP
jgi:hypothetical protein